MSWEIGLLLIGIMGCAGFAWYLYRRSIENTPEDTDQAADADENTDDFEDLLWTGVLLSEVCDDDEDHDSSDNMDADDNEPMDGDGFDDSDGFE